VGFQLFNNKQDFNAAKSVQTSSGASANLSAAQQSLTQNYDQASTGFNFSLSYPLKRHAFQRVGFTYSLSKSTITAFSTASQTFFQTISFRSGIQGSNALSGIVNSMASFTYAYNTINNPMRPRTGKEFSAAFQTSGIWGNVRYFTPEFAYKQFMPMHYLKPSANGRNVLGLRAQLGYVQGYGGAVAPPQNRFYSGGEGELRGFDTRGAMPYGWVPSRSSVLLTNPDGNHVPRDPANPQLCTIQSQANCEQIPIPVYGIASIGGDTNLTVNAEYRIPIAGPVTFSLFNDFGIDVSLNKGQLEQSIQGFESLISGGYGCASFDPSGACVIAVPGSKVGLQRNIHPVAGTNFVPRMSTGAELSVIMPIINAPFRYYFAYNPLRLFEQPDCNLGLGSKNQSCSAQLITRDMFPPGGAGDYTFQEVTSAYGAKNTFREPRKTFRLTVSTTF
jgi:outer membrane protein insertion porin family